MRPRFLADENLNGKIVAGLLRREPAIDFETAKDAELLGLPDPEVLSIAARDRRMLVTHDRETMPRHFARFIEGRTSPGVLIVSQKLDIGETIEEVLLFWAASEAEEWTDRIVYLPL
jgi:predicted nuclease of predicted toxin-antitoxin system